MSQASPSFEKIRYTVGDHIATITLDDPDTRNSLSDQLLGELITALRSARSDDNVRVVVLASSHEKVFSAGGNLDQHLPDRLGHEGHRTVPGSFDEHEVELSEGSMIAGLCGRNRLVVSSHHHQGLDRIGEGLRVTGVAVPDGIVEAIEVEGRDFAIGVQWHPEYWVESDVVSAKLFKAFGEAVRAYAARR